MAKCEDLHGDKTHYELRRQYHCAAYKALMAVISCTQSKMQFYNAFLFKEDLNKVRKEQNITFILWLSCTMLGSASVGEFGGSREDLSFRD